MGFGTIRNRQLKKKAPWRRLLRRMQVRLSLGKGRKREGRRWYSGLHRALQMCSDPHQP